MTKRADNSNTMSHVLCVHTLQMAKVRTRRYHHYQLVCKNLCFHALIALILVALQQTNHKLSEMPANEDNQNLASKKLIHFAHAHVVLTRDDQSSSLVLTGEDGKGEESSGDQLVIAGNNMGGGQDSRMVMQNAANREGDVVMNGKSMIIPGEDGHIVLADSRQQDDGIRRSPVPPNLFMLWLPYMSPRFAYRMIPFFG